MLHDAETPEGRAAFDRPFDVCIIGAGPAGERGSRSPAGSPPAASQSR